MRNFLSRRNDGDNFGLDFWGLNDPFERIFNDSFFAPATDFMRTDVKENEKGYELKIDMPGYEKEEIELSLNDGYVTVSAEKKEKENNENFVRRERRFSCSRSYFVGNGVTEKDIKAKYNNGTLTLSIPKTDVIEQKKHNIEID